MGDNEVIMARAGLRVGAVLGVPLVLVAGLWHGVPGLVTALGGLVLVVGSFYVTGRSLHWAAGIGPTMVQAVALGGFLARILFYGALILLLRDVSVVDGPVLVISVVTTIVVLLAYEVRLALNNKALWWVHVPAPQPLTDRKERA